ncbi:hypothetical protein GUJ93_ZPchr0010g11106 [Zizania palustris]|uniref:Uncharacterized protein n=1 Tax=Zizania palustris TaxID=103762 RepID=A0A8J5WBT3_ZIZPA|nr:hypothetical protein GUJ93_ZPchr0010g11106 [Zizania palustris]
MGFGKKTSQHDHAVADVAGGHGRAVVGASGGQRTLARQRAMNISSAGGATVRSSMWFGAQSCGRRCDWGRGCMIIDASEGYAQFDRDRTVKRDD